MLNTFFNYRTSHHTKVLARDARRQQNAELNAAIVSLFTRGKRKAAAAEAERFRQMGAAVSAPPAPPPPYGTLEYQTWYAETYPEQYAEWLRQNGQGS